MSLTLASGGHPLPFRLDPLGNVEPVGAPGMLLGIDGTPDLSDAEVELAPGDSLLVYTDGVTETPVPGGISGREASRACSRPAATSTRRRCSSTSTRA